MMTKEEYEALPSVVTNFANEAIANGDEDKRRLAILACVLHCGIGMVRELAEYMEHHTQPGNSTVLLEGEPHE